MHRPERPLLRYAPFVHYSSVSGKNIEESVSLHSISGLRSGAVFGWAVYVLSAGWRLDARPLVVCGF